MIKEILEKKGWLKKIDKRKERKKKNKEREKERESMRMDMYKKICIPCFCL